jgi:hypothetical protein
VQNIGSSFRRFDRFDNQWQLYPLLPSHRITASTNRGHSGERRIRKF